MIGAELERRADQLIQERFESSIFAQDLKQIEREIESAWRKGFVDQYGIENAIRAFVIRRSGKNRPDVAVLTEPAFFRSVGLESALFGVAVPVDCVKNGVRCFRAECAVFACGFRHQGGLAAGFRENQVQKGFRRALYCSAFAGGGAPAARIHGESGFSGNKKAVCRNGHEIERDFCFSARAEL